MKHVDLMLDLETLSTDPEACIMQISAVPFSLELGTTLPEIRNFNTLVDPATSSAVGSKIDGSTIKWWLSQEGEVVQRVLVQAILNGDPLKYALHAFSEYIKEIKERMKVDRVTLWGNGIKADNVWLSNQYKLANLPFPVTYRDDMDMRTIKLIGDVFGIDTSIDSIPFCGNKHNAIDDCIHQVKVVLAIRNGLKKL